MRFKLSDKALYKLLNFLGLDPEDKGGYFLSSCPECGRKEAFVYKGGDILICNRRNKCNYKTAIWDLVKEDKGFQDKEIISFITSGEEDFSVRDFVPVIKELELPKSMKFFVEVREGFLRSRAYGYLVNRGIPDSSIKELGYVCDGDSEYNNRIIIPFYENGRIVYFQARDFTGKSFLRYKNPTGVSSKQFIYNIDKIEEGGTVFIFEGLFDALSLDRQVGTAMLSADLNKTQAIKILDKAPSKIVFVPDNDETGKRTLEKNIRILSSLCKPASLDIEVYVYDIEESKDFNDTGKNMIELSECIKWKKNPSKYLKWQN